LSPPELEDLDVVLDTGEVSATLSVGGVSTVWETRFAGVWRVRHHDGFNEIAADEIHVTRIPDVLVTQDEDIAFSAARLAALSGADVTTCQTSRSEEDVSRG
jgi:hydrogenase-1 operon protein HyaF